jgi:protein-disulfide isomerase
MKISKLVAVSSLALLLSAQGFAAKAAAESPNMPVAKIGSNVIKLKELEDAAKDDLKQLEEAYKERKQQIREQALDRLITDKLLTAKAKSAGKTVDAYVKENVTDKVAAPTEDEVKSTYEQAKARTPNLPAMDTLKEQIVSFLKQQKSQGVEEAFHKKLKEEGNVQILLKSAHAEPVKVEAKGESRGPANAKVTIVAFSDYECPYCSVGEKSIGEVLAAYPNDVKLVFRDYPLPIHPEAPKAAEAAHCAKDQGKYWEMHDKLFANQKALKIADLKNYAKDLKLDEAKFDKCLESGEKAHIISDSVEAGRKLNVNGTPAFFINGILVSGAQPFEKFKQIIDEELATKKKKPSKG